MSVTKEDLERIIVVAEDIMHDRKVCEYLKVDYNRLNDKEIETIYRFAIDYVIEEEK